MKERGCADGLPAPRVGGSSHLLLALIYSGGDFHTFTLTPKKRYKIAFVTTKMKNVLLYDFKNQLLQLLCKNPVALALSLSVLLGELLLPFNW